MSNKLFLLLPITCRPQLGSEARVPGYKPFLGKAFTIYILPPLPARLLPFWASLEVSGSCPPPCA